MSQNTVWESFKQVYQEINLKKPYKSIFLSNFFRSKIKIRNF